MPTREDLGLEFEFDFTARYGGKTVTKRMSISRGMLADSQVEVLGWTLGRSLGELIKAVRAGDGSEGGG